MDDPFHIPPDIHRGIMRRLSDIEAREEVRILFAIESGSRAWGFPSPDSDFDVRFVYARPLDWYLSIKPGRDVIELPIDGDYDINGWDIRKALELLQKPNPVLLEWLTSPIRYVWDETACSALLDFAGRVAHARACRHHYLHLCQGQWRKHVEGYDQVRLKKYLYVVRPAMALRWIRLKPEILPPMNFQALCAGAEIGQEITDALDELLAKKAQSRELGLGSRVTAIDDLITSEMALTEAALGERYQPAGQRRLDADQLFRQLIGVNRPGL